MSKVIVERPRVIYYKGKKSLRKGFYVNPYSVEHIQEYESYDGYDFDEEGVYSGYKESMRPKGTRIERKQLNENLMPLIRFLESKVGNNWNNVYSEIRENINPNSSIQKHILNHVKQFVITDTVLLEDGRIISYVPYWQRDSDYYVLNDANKEISKNEFYVHPETGILYGARTKYNFRKIGRNPTNRIYQINPLEQYRETLGVWWHIQLTEWNSNSIPENDILFNNENKPKDFSFEAEYGSENLRAHSYRKCGINEVNKILKLIESDRKNYFYPR